MSNNWGKGGGRKRCCIQTDRHSGNDITQMPFFDFFSIKLS